jgi:RecA-family ATPase
MRDNNIVSIERGADVLDRHITNAGNSKVPTHHPGSRDATGTDLASPRAVVRRLSQIEAKPIRWLWPGRIARGKVSMIAGHPGLGKSQLTAALAAVVTTGGRWPVDRTPCERGRVILLNAEDDAADTIRPRLEAAGANLDYCEILDAVTDSYGPDGRPITRGFSIKVDLGVLDELLTVRQDVALVVIDPVTAYLAGVDSHINADVRAVLTPLGDIASKHGVAIVCVSHLNKGGAGKTSTGEAMLRVSGSLAFVAAARAAFIVAKDPENPSRRLFPPAKNNIGKDESGLAFSVESYSLPSQIETSRVLWDPLPSP